MKSLKHTIFSVYILAALGLSAQVPQQINYQAVARNAAGLVLANQSVSVRFTIHDATPTGAIDYQEVQTGLSTNQFGLFTCAIGAGAPVGSYTFTAIVWGTNAKYLQVELDPSGGTNYVDMGTTQLNAVPYALYAASSPAGTAGWGLTGNTGTRYGTDFIGTKDTINLMFRIYDSIAGRIEPGNASLGYLALDNNTTGSENVALGSYAMDRNTSGGANTAIGFGALYSNTTLGNNLAIGTYALFSNTSAGNTAVGGFALYADSGAYANGNTAVGFRALQTNNSFSNTALGLGALYNNASGFYNTAVGAQTMYYNANGAGSYNAILGAYALSGNNNGSNNIAVGYNALGRDTNGNNNVALGIFALYNNPTLSYQVAVGDSALYNNNGGTGNNTAIGSKALVSTTTGYRNTATGFQSLYNNLTGYENTANGSLSLNASTGNENTAVGYKSLLTSTTGNTNTAIGAFADVSSGGISGATAVGYNAKAGADNAVILGNAANDSVAVGIGTTTPVAKLDIHASTGFNALHIAGLTGGTDSTEQILTINRLTGMVDSTHLLHYVGEYYGDGIVFLVYDNGLHGLIAATSDQSTSMRWYAGTNTNTMAFAGASLGNWVNGGRANTNLIIASQSLGDGNIYAARICNEIYSYMFNDWYLPSQSELSLMNKNIGLAATGANYNIGGFANANYWSSSEYSSTMAWFVTFGTNSSGSYAVKSTTNHVRAIRAF